MTSEIDRSGPHAPHGGPAHLHQLRSLGPAFVGGVRTAQVELAPGRPLIRGWNLPGNGAHQVIVVADVWRRVPNRGGVLVRGGVEDIADGGDLDRLT
ncbi:MAG TPA: hypothetical protein PKY70_18790, partial [Nakamurella multipartita]|nr:hypothetical protein [Nakamurella multipartita]